VTVHWGDVNARARGLGSHLLPSETLASVTRLHTWEDMTRALTSAGILPDEATVGSPVEVELALRRWAAGEIRVVRRWLGSRAAVLSVALDAEDRRSLRALVRGAAAGVPAAVRLTGLLPTTALPERLLQELAARDRIPDQAALLVAAGHPVGPALLVAAAETKPDLFAVELAISRVFAESAARGARRDGRALRTHVEAVIDAINCRSALLLAHGASAKSPVEAFIPGGRRLTLERFTAAAGAPDPFTGARILAAIDERSAEAWRDAADVAALEAALEGAEDRRLEHLARMDPLGPAPTLLYLRRLGGQLVALGEAVWSLDLGVAPPRSSRMAIGGVA
jgi:vacuolar-type H+-ATPase subunit C/Vma6